MRNKLRSICNKLIVLLPLMINLPLKHKIGNYGMSLHNLIWPIFLYLIIKDKNKNIKQRKKGLYLFLLICIFSFLSIINYKYILGMNLEYRGENLIIKTLKILMYFISGIVLYIYSVENLRSEKKIFKWMYRINYFLGLILLIELKRPEIINFLNNGLGNRPGIRLLTMEPSYTGVVIIFYFFGGVYYCLKNKKMKGYISITILFLIQLAYSSSKLFLGIGLLNLLLVNFYFIKNNIRRYKKILYISIGVIIYIFVINIYEQLYKLICNDLKYYTSISTRITTMIILLRYTSQNIFCTGGVYLYYFIKEIQNLPKEYLNTELIGWLNAETNKDIVVKSGYLMFMQFYGVIPFIYFIKGIVYNNLKKVKKYKLLLYLNMIIFPIFSPLLEIPCFFIALALIYIYKEEKE